MKYKIIFANENVKTIIGDGHSIDEKNNLFIVKDRQIVAVFVDGYWLGFVCEELVLDEEE